MAKKPTYKELEQKGKQLEKVNEQLEKEIKERKQAEKALEESEEKYRHLFESSAVGIDIATKSGKILESNHTMQQMMGYSMDELSHLDLYETYVNPEDREDFLRIVDQDGRVENFEVQLLTKKGAPYWVNLSTRSIQLINEDVLLTTAINIQYQKEAENNLKQANKQLLSVHNQRKILSKRLIDLLEKERRQIAMELHDHIGQALTSLKIDIEILNDQLKPISNELRSMAQAAADKTMQAIKDVKNISHGMRPTMIDALGIVSSFRNLFREIMQQTGLEIRFFNRGIPKRFEEGKELTIYRIAQEALTNIIRHARAKSVFVNLVKIDDKLSLSVEDDGVGFNKDEAMEITGETGSLGLLIMRERAIQLDGEFTIESQPSKGTHVLVQIPL